MLAFWSREAIEIEVVNMLEDHLGFVTYPIDLDLLASKLDVKMTPYPESDLRSQHLCMSASTDAFTLCTPNFEYVSVHFNSNGYPRTREKFSKAHEIGHIYLESTEIDDPRAESEADYFAGYLLAPHPLIGRYKLASSIASSFGVGSQCAKISLMQYKDRCRLGGPLKEHEKRLLSFARIELKGGEGLGPIQ